ncbi:uncharacterized protein LOC143283109 isoform X2 [Babylonia areolata]|uniref:uncharacterized protein LOC143283109 isoform X2 n=1 Tax=Babylonia areolata TaxID=304850 RepID=UPI003FD58DAB
MGSDQSTFSEGGLGRSKQDPSKFSTSRPIGEASTPSELAVLCSEGSGGWLLSSHIVWVLEQVNRTSRTSVALCLNAATVNDLKGLQQKRNLREVKKLIFILNVGIDYRGTFVSSASKSGCHWALAVVDIAARGNPTTIYCDSLGWECPQNFGTCVQPFLQFFGCGVPSMLVALAHDTTAQNGPHQCTHLCLNYPLQTCGNVCGVIAVIAAVIAAQDD